MTLASVWKNQRLADVPGRYWLGARVFVRQSNCEFYARVLAGSTSGKRAYIKAENAPHASPKWHDTEAIELDEAGGVEK